MQCVASDRNVGDHNFSSGVRDAVVRRLESDHHGVHLRVDVAEDVADSDSVEVDRPGCAGLVESQVETLPFE
jgi:hypothetical protein